MNDIFWLLLVPILTSVLGYLIYKFIVTVLCLGSVDTGRCFPDVELRTHWDSDEFWGEGDET